MGRGHQSRRSSSPWRRLTDSLCDLEELLLLATILLEHLIKINILGVTALDLGSLGLGLLFSLAGLLGRLLSLIEEVNISASNDGGAIFGWRGSRHGGAKHLRTFLAFLASLFFFLSLAIFTGYCLHCGSVLGSLGFEAKILRVDGVARGFDQVKFYHSRHSAIYMICTVFQPDGNNEPDEERKWEFTRIDKG